MCELKDLAKDLCEKSGCHHKCHDTSDCVVEDEALLLITENKSNNSDVKSNEELFKQALVEGLNRHIDKSVEKEKQIDIKKHCEIIEMINVLCTMPCDICSMESKGCINKHIAKRLYNAGYRKQSEGEWETIPDYSRSLITYRHICSVCKTFYKDIRSRGHTYCHECGSKMKGRTIFFSKDEAEKALAKMKGGE